ncbi:MAG: DUF4011 domain-containing protein [Prevotella sp.]|nr:DUF4011 domain-containing protein [Prevotella sp.]
MEGKYKISGKRNGTLFFEYLPEINYAMILNNVSTCVRCMLENNDANDWTTIKLSVAGDMIRPCEVYVEKIGKGQRIQMDGLKIEPDSGKLLMLTERLHSNFTLKVTADNNDVVVEKVFDIDLLPFDHWAGISVMPSLLASFVVPNNPSMAPIAVEASKFLKKWTGSSSLDAYQTQDRQRARLQVAAVYEALRSQGLVYSEPPASFEKTGQRIRLADRVLTEKLATCIDTTLLYASVLESIGLYPIVIILRGHALLGVWLTEQFYSQNVGDDATYLLKQSADGIHDMVLVETTGLTSSQPMSFDEATEQGEKAVRQESNFQLFVDIHRCRLDKIRPLPQLTKLADGTMAAIETDPHEHATEDIRQLDHYALHLDQTGTPLTKQTIWERKLLDFSLRNNLINCRLGRRVVPFVSFSIDKLEDNIHAGIDYGVVPYPQTCIDPTDKGIFDSKLQASDLKDMVASEIKDNHQLVSYLSEAELNTALKFIYRASRNSLEENGANTLFLAIGMLKWYENEKSVLPRFAPLLLLPVDIIRKGGQKYILRTRDEETMLNITLVELLKQQFKINIGVLDVLPEDDSGVDVNLVLATIREAIKNMSRWDVMEESMLGLFSFTKFVMWNDIHNNAELLKKNDVVKSLMEGRVALDNADEVADARLIDKQAKPSDFSIPVDVDSSQLEAVVESGRGKSFILYGPPGTGKSQTITNMIANALYQDKRVLFVAEKMAALEVVQKRLAKLGLDPFCLELHSNKVTKSHFLRQMQKALDVVHIKDPEQYKVMSERLFEHRQQLIGYIEKLHKKQPSGFSLYDCISRYLAIEGDEIGEALPKPQDITSEKLEKWIEETEGLETVFQITGTPADHPLSGLLPKEYSMQAANNIRQLLNAFRQEFQATKNAASTLPLQISLSDKDLAWVSKTQKACHQLPQQGALEFLQQNADQIKAQWEEVKNKWFLPRFFAKRSFTKGFRHFFANIQFDEIPQMLEMQKSFNQLLQEYCMNHNANFAQVQQALFGTNQLTLLDNLTNQVQKIWNIQGQLLQSTDIDLAIGTHTQPISRVEAINSQIDKWLGGLDKIKDWTLWTDHKRQLEQQGLSCLTKYIEREAPTPHEAALALQKGLFHLLTIDTVERDPELARFNGLLFEELVDKYKQETYMFQNLSKEELYCRLASRIPSQTMAATANSEMGILKRNIANGGRGTSIRKIIDQIPSLLPKLCPCMLMSPISVAQYIDMGGEKFDLVIFDEASQMPTSEAIGAIARGKALICVGDPKQMPPTSFFTTQQVDEDEAEIDDMESILDDCITLSMPGHYLSWHYRSKHESLIAFSNLQYYDGKLHTFPSVDDRMRKVSLVNVEGTYDKGRTRSNKAEAQAIVDEVVRRLSDDELSKRSIGIVSFSKVQQDLIEDVLIEELAKNPELERRAYDVEEPIFIKNLENVQGDERDVILFSVGYGPDKHGNVSMNFGPLNNEGGERRLNVAVSRARFEMIVYATLRPEQIDLKRSQAKGVEGLKKFLEFASTGHIVTNAQQLSMSDHMATQEMQRASTFNQLIAEELRNNGYDVETMIGRSQFKVDIAVVDPEDPNNYILGILCDGKNYYETKTTRDREIVQPGVLSGLHWNVMRIWAVDWYEHKEQVMDRILKRLNDIQNNVPAEAPPSDELKAQANKAFQVPETKQVEEQKNDRQLEYRVTKLDKTKLKFDEKNDLLRQRATSRIMTLLSGEQPITNHLIYKRMAEYFGITRAGQRVQEYIDVILMSNAYMDPISNDQCAIYWTDQEAARNYNSYRIGGGRDPQEIPVIEAMNAVSHAVEQNISVPTDDLKRVTAQLLGFTRRGSKIDALTEKAIGILLERQVLTEADGRITLKNQTS